MLIENAKWSKAPSSPDGNEGSIIGFLATIDGIKMSVPKDTGNIHYAEAMRQVAAGTLTIADAD